MDNATPSLYITNSTTDASLLEEDYSLSVSIFHLIQVICIICYSITFILGIIGNGLVIWIAGFKMKKMVTTVWFLNLGVADFALNSFLPLHITEWAMDGYWPFGQIMCKGFHTVVFLNMTLSTSFLMIISIDRCTLVLCPVWSKNHRTPRFAFIISVVIWILCLILCSPNFFFFDIEHDVLTNMSYCYNSYAVISNEISILDLTTWSIRHNAMNITRFVSMFLIPFSIIVLSYGLILFRVRRIRSISGSGQTFKVILTIVLCFFCCWFPFNVLPLLDLLGINFSWTLNYIMFNISYCLALFNSCLNPLVYVFIGQDFKKSLYKSIPFLMENTFRERYDLDGESQNRQNVVETELETLHS
ncbi:formyl peptide receptor-related sequence 4-like [Rhinophrynus dorsalis]